MKEGELRESVTAVIRQEAGLLCGSCLRKGKVFACVGRIHNLKDLKDLKVITVTRVPTIRPCSSMYDMILVQDLGFGGLVLVGGCWGC